MAEAKETDPLLEATEGAANRNSITIPIHLTLYQQNSNQS